MIKRRPFLFALALCLSLLLSAAAAVCAADLPELRILAPARIEPGGEFNLILELEGSSALAAGDFTLIYDKTRFAVTAEPTASPALSGVGIVVVNPKYADGTVRFSFLCEDGLKSDRQLLVVPMRAVGAAGERGSFSVSGRGLVDVNYRTVQLAYPEASIAIGSPSANPFADVAEGSYYYDAVIWAVNHDPQITTGMDDTHFVPNADCTRGQVVTFLWRAVGKPEPKTTSCAFTDVSPEKYYYKAVLWAAETGVTTGVTSTAFDPNGTCTRGQVVTFLYRAKKAAPVSGGSSFPDVPAGAYFAQPVQWAVANGITNGMGNGLFAPNRTCTRAQIVTFLHRANQV